MPRVRASDYDDKKLKRDDSKKNENVMRSEWQTWHMNGTRCPKGTVPIRRSSERDVLRAKSLFHFGKKQQKRQLKQRTTTNSRSEPPDVVSGNGHEVYIST